MRADHVQRRRATERRSAHTYLVPPPGRMRLDTAVVKKPTRRGYLLLPLRLALQQVGLDAPRHVDARLRASAACSTAPRPSRDSSPRPARRAATPAHLQTRPPLPSGRDEEEWVGEEETLTHVARRCLGVGHRFHEILTWNGFSERDTRRMAVGTAIKIKRSEMR